MSQTQSPSPKPLTQKLIHELTQILEQFNIYSEVVAVDESGKWVVIYLRTKWSWKEFKRVQLNVANIKRELSSKFKRRVFVKVVKKPVTGFVNSKKIMFNIKAGYLNE